MTVKLIIISLVTIIVAGFTYSEKIQQSDTHTSEPVLLTKDPITYPSILFKKHIEGVYSIEIDISSKGAVERCVVKEHLHPVLDSIIFNYIMNSRFSPAYDLGTPVPSTVTFQIPFNSDSILISSNQITSELEGFVFDRDSKLPIPDAIVNLQYSDTTFDTSLTNRFNSYLEKIGRLPGQKVNSGILSTKTDSSGHFVFRLLPDGTATVAVLASRYTIAHFKEQTSTGVHKKVNYYLEPFVEYQDSQYTITVYGRDTTRREIVNLEKQQYSSGLTHYLSNIILKKSVIRQVPEAASALLVRSGSPYDNCYLIAGVPMPAPFHFGGYQYADIDGIMVSTLDNVKVTVNRIAGAFPDISGALIEVNPGIYRPASKKLKKRKELSIDFSTISQDFLLSFPIRKNDYFQLGFTRSEDHSLRWMKAFNKTNPESEFHVGSPANFGNFTFTGKYLLKNIQTEFFSWFAYDLYQYTHSDNSFYPWGMTSIKMYPSKNKNISLTAGGGHQYFADGIKVQWNSFYKEMQLSNGILTLNLDSIIHSIVNVNITQNLQYHKWTGSVKQRSYFGIDTSINESGKKITYNIQTTISKSIRQFEISSNVLVQGARFYRKPLINFDGGMSLQWKNEMFDAELNVGTITSYPDIRGIPDSTYRSESFRTYIASLPLSCNFKDKFSIQVQPYTRYQDKTPCMDPLFKTWDPARTSSVKAYGTDCDFQIKPLRWLELNAAVNVAHAYRDNSDASYEWDIPFSLRGRLHCTFLKEMFHFYLDEKYSNGLPYFDFKEKQYESLPDYNRLDFSVQYRSVIHQERFLSRYDAYFTVSNILSNFNVRSYYWDENMIDHPIILSGPVYTEIGVRFAFRL